MGGGEMRKRFLLGFATGCLVAFLLAAFTSVESQAGLTLYQIFNQAFNTTSLSLANNTGSAYYYERHAQDATADNIDTNVVYRSVTLCNDGANEVFAELDGTTATTANIRIDPAECFTARINTSTTQDIVSLICSAAETTTVDVYVSNQ